MIANKTLKAIEFDKILKDVASFAVLEKTKLEISNFVPLTNLSEYEVSAMKRTMELINKNKE